MTSGSWLSSSLDQLIWGEKQHTFTPVDIGQSSMTLTCMFFEMKEAGVCKEIPHKHGKNIQTSHRNAGAVIWTPYLKTVRQMWYPLKNHTALPNMCCYLNISQQPQCFGSTKWNWFSRGFNCCKFGVWSFETHQCLLVLWFHIVQFSLWFRYLLF